MTTLRMCMRALCALALLIWMLPALAREADQNEAARAKD